MQAIGTDRILLTGHNALLLRKIAGDLLHALSNRHDNTCHAFGKPVCGTGGSKLVTRPNIVLRTVLLGDFF